MPSHEEEQSPKVKKRHLPYGATWYRVVKYDKPPHGSVRHCTVPLVSMNRTTGAKQHDAVLRGTSWR
uniref:Uncharacterized protein n=1 Tax=Romanomermis culicivorax TaxID=13658 RepID=A0A915I1K0_ROMCU